MSSRPRNSTTLTALDWLLAGTLALAVIVAAVGVDFAIGGLPVRSHSAWRVLAGAAVVLWLRLRLGVESLPAWLTRIVLLTVIAGSVGTWFRFLLTTAGGADSYGYVSASQLLRSGHLVAPAPIAEWLSAENRLSLASPLGWAPAAGGNGIVPTYPLGLPIVMAVFSAVAGSQAVYFVAPVLALLTLFLVYRVACQWFDREIALVAVALTAWNPVFLTYAKQPMSDGPAAFWIMLAITLALRASPSSALGAGLAAGAAVMTRPVLLIAAGLMPLLVRSHGVSGFSRTDRRVLCTVGLAVVILLQMLVQATLFGSPFASGYGSTDSLFSLSFLGANLGIYGRQIWFALGALWLAGLGLGVQVTPAALRWRVFAVAGAVVAPYLVYLPFDHWETLRFLLPGLVPLTLIVAAGAMRLARIAPNRWTVAVFIVVLVAGFTARSEVLLRRSSVWQIQALEARYPLAAEWVNVNTPPGSVVLANQHSGSIRWYSDRQTLRWDFIEPERLVTTVNELAARGAGVYVALEGREVEMFDQRFAAVIDRVRVDHVGRMRNVEFRRLAYLPNK